ncbi:hypothetical protein JCGZ_18442 [Jatropha curcas]|uniref:Uncharacterized protein n=1 Tax=Jatropha curcas TaxID=180498 RepID=A0A067K160_JATCU|nr:hypothetical protein JCGZ_18442 [Jatropha curcas]
MEKGRWKRKVEEEDEDKDEEEKMKWKSRVHLQNINDFYVKITTCYIPFYPTLDSNGSNRGLGQPDSTRLYATTHSMQRLDSTTYYFRHRKMGRYKK